MINWCQDWTSSFVVYQQNFSRISQHYCQLEEQLDVNSVFELDRKRFPIDAGKTTREINKDLVNIYFALHIVLQIM